MARGTQARRRCVLIAVCALVISSVLAASPAVAAGPGTPYTWGNNAYGQLGDGTNSSHSTAAPVSGFDDATDLHGGRQHVIALASNGTVRTWGRNNFGQLGVGGGARNTPTVVPGLSNVIAVETGHYHSLALLDDGTVWTWGFNGFGQLGNGTTTNSNSPVQVSGLNDAIAIAAGRNMSYAIRSNGQVWGWGANDDGQMGDGTNVNRTTPVRVGSLTNITSIAGGRDHGLAVNANGAVWAWGDNRWGQLGDGTTVDRTNPVQVTTGAQDVIAGAHHSYALMNNGTVQSWGRGYRGQLGNGSTAQRTTPVTVSGIDNAVAIATGRDHGLAVLDDGTVRSWGYNDNGQLGDGTTTTRTTPVTVPGISNAEIGGAGRDYSVVLVSDGPPPPPPPNQAPTARITGGCSGLSCSFSGSTSTDPDGSIVSYSWQFGDGSSDNGVNVSHTYGSPGTYDVTLTVVDDDGANDADTESFTVTDVVADVAFRAAASVNGNTVTSQINVPGAVQGGDQLVLVVTVNRNVSLTTPAGWTLLGSEQDGSPDMRSWLLTRTAPGGYGGSSVAITTSALSKKAVTMVAYSGAAAVSLFDSANEPGRSTTHAAPSISGVPEGSLVAAYWSDKGSGSSWTLPGGVVQRVTSSGSGGGQINAIMGEAGPVTGGSWPGATATSTFNASKAIMWTVVISSA